MAVARLLDTVIAKNHLLHEVYWSLNCEIIYYLIYPFLLKLKTRFSWISMISILYIVSGILVFSGTPKALMQDYGEGLNWFVWLPMWLAGCQLAESSSFPKLSQPMLWLTRLGIWFLSSLAVYLNWKFPLGTPRGIFWLLIPGFFWIRAEIGSFQTSALSKVMEKMGAWSYSLYLIHPLVLWGTVQIIGGQKVGGWLIGAVLVASVSVAIVFYWLVEKPSVALARSLSSKWASKATD